MDKYPIVILEDSAFFKKGQVIENYSQHEEGILVEEKYISSDNYVVLTEALSAQDERKIKELIKQQFKILFWNLYTKQSFMLGN